MLHENPKNGSAAKTRKLFWRPNTGEVLQRTSKHSLLCSPQTKIVFLCFFPALLRLDRFFPARTSENPSFQTRTCRSFKKSTPKALLEDTHPEKIVSPNDRLHKLRKRTAKNSFIKNSTQTVRHHRENVDCWGYRDTTERTSPTSLRTGLPLCVNRGITGPPLCAAYR